MIVLILRPGWPLEAALLYGLVHAHAFTHTHVRTEYQDPV